MALNPKELAPKIQGFHALLATITKQPVFVINDTEAAMLAASISEVSVYYDLNLGTGKYMALINLAAVAGMVYVPRVVAISKANRAAKAPPPQSMSDAEAEIFAHMAEPVQPPQAGKMDYSGLQ